MLPTSRGRGGRHKLRSEPCSFYLKGKCRRGNSCEYFHCLPDHRENWKKPTHKPIQPTDGLTQTELAETKRVARHVCSDMTFWEQSNIWPFSSYWPPGELSVTHLDDEPYLHFFTDISLEEVKYAMLMSKGNPSKYQLSLVNRYNCAQRQRRNFATNQGTCQKEIIAQIYEYRVPVEAYYSSTYVSNECQIGSEEFSRGLPFFERLKRTMGDLAVFDKWFGKIQANMAASSAWTNVIPRATLKAIDCPKASDNSSSQEISTLGQSEMDVDKENAVPSREHAVAHGKRPFGMHTTSNIQSTVAAIQYQMQKRKIDEMPFTGMNPAGAFTKKLPSNKPFSKFHELYANKQLTAPVRASHMDNENGRGGGSLNNMEISNRIDHDFRPPAAKTKPVVPKPKAPFRQVKPNQLGSGSELDQTPKPEPDYLASDVEMKDLSDLNPSNSKTLKHEGTYWGEPLEFDFDYLSKSLGPIFVDTLDQKTVSSEGSWTIRITKYERQLIAENAEFLLEISEQTRELPLEDIEEVGQDDFMPNPSALSDADNSENELEDIMYSYTEEPGTELTEPNTIQSAEGQTQTVVAIIESPQVGQTESKFLEFYFPESELASYYEDLETQPLDAQAELLVADHEINLLDHCVRASVEFIMASCNIM